MERVDPDSGIDLIDGLIVAVTELDSELDSSDRDIYFFVCLILWLRFETALVTKNHHYSSLYGDKLAHVWSIAPSLPPFLSRRLICVNN